MKHTSLLLKLLNSCTSFLPPFGRVGAGSTISLLFVAASSLHAQKIDFDMTGRQSSQVTETGYESWMIPQGLSATETFLADDGSPVEIEINCGDGEPANRTLRANWSKNIVQQNSKLVGDAIVVKGLDADNNTPHLTDESATMNFIMRGLPAGEHSLLAYLNATDGNLATMAPVDVSVNGETVSEGVLMSNQELAPSASGQVYITFNAVEGQEVKVSFVSKPEPGITYSTTGIYVNALVFDRPNPKTTALDPYPENLDMHVAADGGTLEMAWTQASSAVKNLVYMGTSGADMRLMAETDEPSYHATGLSTHNVYYWRVDQRDAAGNINEGDTWTFRPRRLAFPGAEGYGRYAIGGRGGSVYHVTSLEDYASGETPIPGTFRYGIREVDGPRTIVFDVAGTIALKERLTCSDSYVTVAGQTAPGKGILLRGAPFGMASDGITRFLRMRRGFHNDDEADMDKGLDGLGMAGCDHAIMDHCSVGWTIDEAFSSRNAKNVTLQRTLISETLNNANHPNYTNANHGYAATIGGDTGSYHHNLLAHNEGRNWSLSGGLDGKGAYAGHHDIFNNVVYNWGGRATDGGTHECNFVGNYYKMGPATTQKYLLRAQLEGTGTGSQSYYVKGNIRESTSGALTEDALGDTYRYEPSNGQVVDWTVFVDKPFFESYADIEPARLAYKTVLSDVGANRPVFDDHDARMVEETFDGSYSCVGSVTGKPGLIDREADAGGYEDYPFEIRDDGFDTDQDGMPDWWERMKGLDPEVADNNYYSDANGYTALEEYLNWIAEPNFKVISGTENSVVNLKTLFAGFGSDVHYNIIGVPVGYVVEENNGDLAVTPPSGANELVTIQVAAEDGDDVGTMARSINLCVISDASGIDTLVDLGETASNTCRIYSLDGILLKSGNDTSSLSPGVYIMEMKSGQNVKSMKITKR